MKKRIISGVVMAAVVAGILWLGLNINSIIITAFVAAIAVIGVYELVSNAAKIESFWIKILASIYTAVMVFASSEILEILSQMNLTSADEFEIDLTAPIIALIITVGYVVLTAVAVIIEQASFDLSKIGTLLGGPIILSFAFSTIASVITVGNGIYYLLLILNFACVTDMGAYFVGVKLGKHKLCSEISPNKTIEGAIGGILSALIVSVIIVFAFGAQSQLVAVLLIGIPMSVVGMLGDLLASVVKRKADIKDYGALIPGHGGILDRVDSLLLISPVMYSLMLLGII